MWNVKAITVYRILKLNVELSYKMHTPSYINKVSQRIKCLLDSWCFKVLVQNFDSYYFVRPKILSNLVIMFVHNFSGKHFNPTSRGVIFGIRVQKYKILHQIKLLWYFQSLFVRFCRFRGEWFSASAGYYLRGKNCRMWISIIQMSIM